MVKRTMDELNLIDDFLMSAVAADEEVGADCCRIILSALLEKDIGDVHVVAQRFIPGPDPGLRGIRMDVEVTEVDPESGKRAANVYDLEPHTRNDIHFPRANRFRQAKVDGRYMESGDNEFTHLPDLYVITILNFDLFGLDHRIYTFRNCCMEIPDLPYEDGLTHVYFNTSGKKGGSKSIENMLNYIQRSNRDSVKDPATERLDKHVQKIRMDPELRRSLMTFGDIINLERKEEREETTARVTEEVTQEVTQDTRIDAILEILAIHGTVPDSVRDRLEELKDSELLRSLIPEAARAQDTDTFLRILDEKTGIPA